MGNARTERNKRRKARQRAGLPSPAQPKKGESRVANMEPDWSGKCEVCEQSPIVPATGMCGPCTFGEAETIGGNW
jgi:hypothetical protein